MRLTSLIALAMVMLPMRGGAWGFDWGPQAHTQAVLDAWTASPLQLSEALAPYLAQLPGAIAEPHELWGTRHAGGELLAAEIARASALLDSEHGYKRFKALIRVAHLAAEALPSCLDERTLPSSRAEDLLPRAVAAGEGFSVLLLPPGEPSPDACGDPSLQTAYAAAVRAVLAAWGQVWNGAPQPLALPSHALRLRAESAPQPSDVELAALHKRARVAAGRPWTPKISIIDPGPTPRPQPATVDEELAEATPAPAVARAQAEQDWQREAAARRQAYATVAGPFEAALHRRNALMTDLYQIIMGSCSYGGIYARRAWQALTDDPYDVAGAYDQLQELWTLVHPRYCKSALMYETKARLDRAQERLEGLASSYEQARDHLDLLPEDCRKAGCLPGWIRE